MNSKKFEEIIEEKISSMSREDMLSYIPDSFLRSAVKGFLAGELGPKKYKKDSWIDSGMDLSRNMRSLIGHILAFSEGKVDPDTGIEDISCFISARAVMNAELDHEYETKKQ